MNMNTQNEINLLADQDLDAAIGGRMKTGMDPKPLPGGSVSAGNSQTAKIEVIGGVLTAVEIMAFMALW
jgi:hypothetical protein